MHIRLLVCLLITAIHTHSELHSLPKSVCYKYIMVICNLEYDIICKVVATFGASCYCIVLSLRFCSILEVTHSNVLRPDWSYVPFQGIPCFGCFSYRWGYLQNRVKDVNLDDMLEACWFIFQIGLLKLSISFCVNQFLLIKSTVNQCWVSYLKSVIN